MIIVYLITAFLFMWYSHRVDCCFRYMVASLIHNEDVSSIPPLWKLAINPVKYPVSKMRKFIRDSKNGATPRNS